MTTLFRILLSIIILSILGWLGYFYYSNDRLPLLSEIKSAVMSIPTLFSEKVPLSSSQLPTIDSSTQTAVGNALGEGKKRVDMVLGEAIEVASDSSKPAAQKAIDYGRYLYCQQVVEEYEATK
jgi:hypothetical protein